MTASAALILSVVMIVLFGVAGIVAGVFWRRRGYRMPIAIGVVGLVLIFLGVWLTASQANRLAQWGSVRNWPATEAVVTTSHVVGERAFHPEIVYEYSVNGTIYGDSTGFDTPSFGGRSVKRDMAEAIVAEYPVGTTVVVHYDPETPSNSVLRISPDWSLYGKIGLGGTLVGVGLFLLLAARRARR